MTSSPSIVTPRKTTTVLVLATLLLSALLVAGFGSVQADTYTTMTAQLPSARDRAASFTDGTYVYNAGGYGGGCAGTNPPNWNLCALTAEIVRYNPATGAVDVPASLPSARQEVAGVWAGTAGYFIGGSVVGWDFENALTQIVKFTPPSSVSVVASLPKPLKMATAVWTGQFVYIFGGRTSGVNQAEQNTQIYKFNPANNQVSVIPGSVASIMGTAAWDGQHIYVLARVDGADNYMDGFKQLNPATNELVTRAARLPFPVCCAATAFDGDFIYMFGGEASTDVIADYVQRYDIDRDEAVILPMRLPEDRHTASGTWFAPHNAAYVLGGTRGGANYLRDIVKYVPTLDAPTNLVATRGPDAIKITLSWSAPSGSVTGYHVYRATTSGGQSGTPTATVTTPQYIDTSVVPSQTYYYKVTAFNGNGDGAYTPEVSQVAPSVASAPLNALAQRGTVPGQILLSWQAPANNGGLAVSGYNIYRGTTSGSATLLTSVGPVTAWNDGNLPNGAQRFYRISATNAAGEGTLSAEVNAFAPDVPSLPTAFSVVGGSASGQIRLSWQAPGTDGGLAVAGYNIYRGNATGALSLLTTVGAVTTWTDTGLPNGALRFYQVSALNAAGEGARAVEASAQAPDVPSVPLDARTTRGPGVGQIKVEWNAPATSGGLSVTNYRIERSDQETGPFTQVAEVGNVLAWTDSGLPNAAVRHYRVAAVNAVGPSAFTAAVPGQAPDRPTTPINVAAVPGTFPGDVELSWTAPNNNGMPILDYAIYRTTVDGGETLRWLAADADNVEQDPFLLPGVRYYYQIAAINAVGEGPKSAQASSRAALLPDLVDTDGDLIPQQVETRVCSTQFIRDLMDSPLYDATGPLIGECRSTSDWDPLIFVDADEDMIPDAGEPTLCLFEDQSDVTDGLCVGDDYGPPLI